MNSKLLESQVIWSNRIDKIDVGICKVIHIGRHNLNCSQTRLSLLGKGRPENCCEELVDQLAYTHTQKNPCN